MSLDFESYEVISEMYKKEATVGKEKVPPGKPRKGYRRAAALLAGTILLVSVLLTECFGKSGEQSDMQLFEKSTADVDLTKMSGTMVYSEVFNMLSAPEQYKGKTVKMNGTFNVYYTEATNTYFFACIVQDATACCAQGLEFVLKGEHIYPDDYPELGEEITVTGVFDTYMEGEYEYCTLRDAEMTEAKQVQA